MKRRVPSPGDDCPGGCSSILIVVWAKKLLCASCAKTLDDTQITPRILSGVTEPDHSIILFGRESKAPFIIAPTAMAGLVHQGGESRAGSCGTAIWDTLLSCHPVLEWRRRNCRSRFRIWICGCRCIFGRNLDYSEQLLKRAWDAGVQSGRDDRGYPEGFAQGMETCAVAFDMPVSDFLSEASAILHCGPVGFYG